MPDANSQKKLISIVAPCFNEHECVQIFCRAIADQFACLPGCELEIVLVNDGSRDGTLDAMLACQDADPRIVVIDLSRNFGKEAALTAGLEAARGDAVIPIDIDLQDPPVLIPQMLAKWQEGFDVVLAHRDDRKTDNVLKRTSAGFFYRIHNRFSSVRLPENVGDFRLMDRRVLDAMKLLPENCRFMKGIFAWLGFRTTSIGYTRPARAAGESKFNFWKLWNFALEGITSFSTVPLRIWTYIGAFFAFGAFVYASIIFLRTLIFGVDVAGYASLLVAITFLGGLQLMGIGIIGEYLGRTFQEAKRRPIYLIRDIYRKP